jgi:DNA-binding NarL/FixJ family response regulator
VAAARFEATHGAIAVVSNPAECRMSIKILVADDHEVVRSGLKSMLHGTDIKIVGEAATGEAALRLTLKHNPDVVLLDVRMVDGDGLTALGRIKLDRPNQAVLMWSAFDNPTYVARAVALGANGYVMKSASKEKLIESIRTVATGETTWTREELRRVTGALATPRLSTDIEVPLTQRESEVLRQLASGATNKEIAVALHISYETVKEHVQHILRKIGVTDRTQAAVWAVRKNLV